jgi:hypothetical protein
LVTLVACRQRVMLSFQVAACARATVADTATKTTAIAASEVDARAGTTLHTPHTSATRTPTIGT